ncbi:MAG: ribbon-helix-helix protein, CopG family [Actinomycetota bacterium]|nr:ribbon-helix-helix protein, CopG family [Actinomycetota bacterium]
MKRAVRINATMDEELLRRLDAFAQTRYEDRSTAIRQLVDFALRELSQRDAVDAYRAGRLTIREFARSLGLDVWGAHDLLAVLGVPVAQGARGESRAGLDELLKSLGRQR